MKSLTEIVSIYTDTETTLAEAIVGKTSHNRNPKYPNGPDENAITEWLDTNGFERIDSMDKPFKFIYRGLSLEKKSYCISDTGTRRAIFIYDLKKGYVIRLDGAKEHYLIELVRVPDEDDWELFKKYMRYNDLIKLLKKNN